MSPPRAILVLSTLIMLALLIVDRAGPASRADAGGLAFVRGSLGISIEAPTSLTFGPDGRLYVASQTEIGALTLNPAGDRVVASERIASGVGMLGIAFDPTTGASPMTLYASGQDTSAPDGFQGIVSKFSAPDWQREDVITGLPTSAPLLNHLTNGLAFDSSGRLFIAQGSASDSGVAEPPGETSYWHETPLSAAILVADVHATGFDGHITYSPAGPPTDDNIDQTGGDVSVYAAGLRNSFDLVVHSNGHIYATDNGALGLITSLACDTDGGATSVSDELNRVEQGNYYGAPNRNRGRTDPRQCTYRDPRVGDGPDYTGPIAILPSHCSCDGLAEYTSAAFGGALRGDLINAEFIRGNVTAIALAADGRDVQSTTQLASGFGSPLDVAVSPSGAIYIAAFTGNEIAFLIPDHAAPTPTASARPTASATPPAGSTATPPHTPTATPTRTAPPTFTPTPTLTPTATPSGRAGDADCDGTVSSIDAALVLQRTAGLIGSLSCQQNADVSGDGRVSAVDAALILQFAAGLLTRLPP